MILERDEMSEEKTKYNGSVFGFNYDMEFATEEEFTAWLIAKLKRYHPTIIKVIDALLLESKEFQKLKGVS
jgi:hypothetical protein